MGRREVRVEEGIWGGITNIKDLLIKSYGDLLL